MIHINHEEKALVNSKDGKLYRPHCWLDLVTYISYVQSRNHPVYAQHILERVFNGDKFITKMIGRAQKLESTNG
jgi:hypothetical protein